MKTTTIEVSTNKGNKENVQAYLIKAKNRKVIFAVHKRLYLYGVKPTPREFPWTITHLPSGYKFSEFRLKRDAKFIARESYLHSNARVNSKNARTAVCAFPSDFGPYLNYIHAYCGLLKLPTYTEWKDART